ncbi:MAG: S-layer homology domain-containing protein [Megasphaera elsdenii]|nr:S-layer homology domain-containing protein [Megasphaera elsdenii]MDY5386276.1 S-layer homology domain-containing protein [Megasphaera elsdenii]
MNENSIALGKDTKANNAQQAVSVAIGENAEASGERSLAIGFGVSEKVNGQDDTTLTSTKASGESAIAIGTDVVAQGQHSVAMGSHTDAAKDSSVAIGFDTHTVSDSAVAIGSGTRAEGRYSVALGLSSVAGKETNDATNPLNGGGSVAIGYGTSAKASRSVAIGTGATAADAEFTTALGDSANAQQRGSVAIGAGSVATRAAGNKEGGTEYKEAYLIPDVSKATDVEKATWTSTEGAVSVGGTAKYQEYDENGNKGTKTKLLTRQITNVAAGSLDTDAVNVAQLKQVQTKHTQVTVEGGTDAGTTAKDGTRTYTGTNLKLNQLTDQNGATVYDLKLADTVTIGGKDGADGTNGVDGHIGVRGKDGEKGANGRDAVSIDGKDGNEGHIGLKGKDGEKGKDGQNAYSDITTHFGPATLNPDKNVKIIKDDVETDAATRLHYVDQNNKEHEVGTMDDGQKYAGDVQASDAKANAFSRKLNEQTNVVGGVTKLDNLSTGNNVGVVSNGTDTLTIRLAKKLTDLTSVTTVTTDDKGNKTSETVQDGNGITITPSTLGAGKTAVSLTDKGLSNGGNQIIHVDSGLKDAAGNKVELQDATGDVLNNAVNVGDLKKVQNVASAHTAVTVNGSVEAPEAGANGALGNYTDEKKGNLLLAQKKDSTGKITYDLKFNDKVTLGKAGTNGKDGIDGSVGLKGADGKSSIGLNGKDGISVIGKDGKNGVSITGSNGLNGKDGIDGKIAIGTPGKDGQPGKDAVSISGQNGEGHIGLTGPAGKDGKDASADIHVKNGQVGVDGTDGHSGKDGMDRVVYEDHNGVTHEVATMDDGQKYAGDFGDGASVKLNKTVTIKGKVKADAKEDDFVDGNIAVVANKKGEDGELLIKLNKDLTGLNSATYTTSTKNGDVTTTSTTVVDGTGLKIENGPSITNTGIDGGSKKITNVADGEISATSKDAVNGSQLNDVKNLAEQHTTVEAGPSGNVTVTPGTNADGSKKYTVDLAKDVTFGDTAKGDKTVAISGTDGTITAGTGDNKVTVDGSKGQIVAGGNNGVKIGNIENGDSSLTIYDKDSKATGKTDKAGKYVTNLDNKTWKDDGSYVSGRAATEDQLHQVESNVNKQIADVNTKIDKVDKHHTEVTVNGGTAAKADGSYTDGNLQIAQKTGSDGQKIYDLKLSDNLNIGGAGKDGKDGQNGHMGINGADGKSGIGIDGEDGISIKGKDGKDGVTIKGIDGKNGTEGHIGLTGSAGKDGQNASADIHVKNGQVGVDGTDGHGGKDGMDRVVYEDHNHVTHEVATMDDGMKYSGDSGKAAVKLNKNVQVYGGATEYADGNNIGVVASQDGDNAKLQVKLAKDFKGINSIEAKTITTGDTTMDNSGLTVKGDGNHKDITIHQGNVNMGGNKVSGVADGKVSQDSTDAVNGSQLWQRDQAINGLSGSVNKLGNRINRVGAGAAALAALHPLDFDPDDKWDFAAGYGNYRGANAAAVGAYSRPNEDTMFSVGGSFGGGENMVNAGVSIKLGQGNHVSTSRVAMAKEMKAMRQHMAEQDALIAKLQSMHGMAVDPAKSTLFPDVAENHWAYQYVTTLAKKGILEGYPDGEFKGDRMMTRYEFAAIVYRIVESGVGSTDPELSKLVKEFSPELQYIRIDTIQKDRDGKPTIERVRVISDAK